MKYAISNLLFALLSCLTINVFAQELEQQVVNHITKLEKIDKARSLIGEYIANNNPQKVKELVEYLELQEDSNHQAFQSTEKYLIYFWSRDFHLILKEEFLAVKQNQHYYRIYPNNNLVWIQLKTILENKKSEVKAAIKSANYLNEENAKFLALYFDYLIGGSTYYGQPNEDLNTAAKHFLFAYPNSRFAPYVRQYIKMEFDLSDWGAEYFIGGGAHFGTEFLGSSFRNGGHFKMGIALYYKKLFLNTNFILGSLVPDQDIRNNDTIWERNHSSSIFQFETGIGFHFLSSKRLSFQPMLGIGSTSITASFNPSDASEAFYEDVGYKGRFTSYAGFGLKFKIRKEDIPNNFFQSHGFLRLTYRFSSPDFENGYSGVTGDIHSLSLIYGGFGKAVKRRY